MFCPKCGQQQIVEEVRYCPRCGFTLGLVAELLANNGMMPAHLVPGDPLARELSPQRRGLRQGGTLVIVGAALTPILALLRLAIGLDTEVILFGVIVLIVGIARLLYAALFEEGGGMRPGALPPSQQQTAAPPLQPSQPHAALPQRQPPAPVDFRRGDTAELVAPPASVTENTTRLLDKQADDTSR
ncbi:MAG TPA: zinc ribbon domain-containing protein [Pyrinomonadaceae bacterium]|nr:zinc ribbon domain-containing protein [Pyrinomonadaceae bacterium]